MDGCPGLGTNVTATIFTNFCAFCVASAFNYLSETVWLSFFFILNVGYCSALTILLIRQKFYENINIVRTCHTRKSVLKLHTLLSELEVYFSELEALTNSLICAAVMLRPGRIWPLWWPVMITNYNKLSKKVIIPFLPLEFCLF